MSAASDISASFVRVFEAIFGRQLLLLLLKIGIFQESGWFKSQFIMQKVEMVDLCWVSAFSKESMDECFGDLSQGAIGSLSGPGRR